MQTVPFQLSWWQKMQVTLLYHFASLHYLKGLQQRLHALTGAKHPALGQAKPQRRDAMRKDVRLGTRNTAQSWANNGRSFLGDFEQSVAADIAKRTFELYSITGANQCGRGMAEFSLGWMAPDEQDDFEARFEKISLYAMNIDYTMHQHGLAGRWKDFSLALRCQEYPEALKQAPALRLRPDITGTSGMPPVRTGVYLPLDDPHGTPQFCWTGRPAGRLLECNTFNDLGLEALAAIGRSDLWINDNRMHAFVQNHLNDPRLTRDSFFTDSIAAPELAPSLVARNAFTSRPCSWIYVEQIHGELEDLAEESGAETTGSGPRDEAKATFDLAVDTINKSIAYRHKAYRLAIPSN